VELQKIEASCPSPVLRLQWEAHQDQNIFSVSRIDFFLLFLILATPRFKGSPNVAVTIYTIFVICFICYPHSVFHVVLRINSDCFSQTVR
jgi:hypothetical protein